MNIRRSSTSLIEAQMIPTAKRKVPEDSNPLVSTAKRTKKDQTKGASNKRKLLHGEEQPGGLLIVRAPNPNSRPSSAQGNHPSNTNPASNHSIHKPPSRPSSSLSHPQLPQTSTAGAGPSKPPGKKFRAEPTSKPYIREHDRDVLSTTREDPDVDEDVRAMEDEADHLRRHSRAPVDADVSEPSIARLNREFRFPVPSSSGESRNVGRRSGMKDASVVLPAQETPQIEKNKLMREGASGSQRAKSDGGHRRKSSISSRGKRISGVFETTGVISQPHNSVSDTSFYKHIDCDLPEPERARQLLIWCASRAASGSASISSTSKSKPVPQLPPLSTKAAELLKGVQEDVIRMLAERKIPIRLFSKEGEGVNGKGDRKKKDNEQNVKNREWEVTYGAHIKRAQQEAEAWKQVDYFYDSYMKKLEAEGIPDPQLQSTPSAKSKGKQRATDDMSIDGEDWNFREHELPEVFRRGGVELAKAVLDVPKTKFKGEERVVGPAPSREMGVEAELRARKEKEAEIQRRVGDLEFKLDRLHSFANAARKTTNVVEAALDHRFALLSFSLASRSNPVPADLVSGAGGQGHMLSTYVPRGMGEGRAGMSRTDPQELLRALARVDRERPPAMVGDAARRAVREVQRVEESGAPGVGERRLTGVPMPQTPRKMPGTPRRGSTPGRDRER